MKLKSDSPSHSGQWLPRGVTWYALVTGFLHHIKCRTLLAQGRLPRAHTQLRLGPLRASLWLCVRWMRAAAVGSSRRVGREHGTAATQTRNANLPQERFASPRTIHSRAAIPDPGVVHVEQPFNLCKEGTVISPEQAKLLVGQPCTQVWAVLILCSGSFQNQDSDIHSAIARNVG